MELFKYMVQVFSTCGCSSHRNIQVFSLGPQRTAATMTKLSIYSKTSGWAFKTSDRALKCSVELLKVRSRVLETWPRACVITQPMLPQLQSARVTFIYLMILIYVQIEQHPVIPIKCSASLLSLLFLTKTLII